MLIMNEPYDFGARLKKYRNEKKITQERIAKILGVSNSMISKYENNTASPSLDSLCTLSKELCVSIDELCGLQQSGTVSLIGLTDGQADCVRLLIDAFHEYNNTVRKSLSDEQYRVLGQILAEFLK